MISGLIPPGIGPTEGGRSKKTHDSQIILHRGIMKNTTRLVRWDPMVGILVTLLVAGSSQAQLIPNIVNGSNPVMNEYGRPLPLAGKALVQVLRVNGGIQPPTRDGLAHHDNPVVYTGHIGQGVVDEIEYEGQFSLMVTPRVTSAFFIRVFNRVTVDQSSFYTDSQSFTPNMDARFVPVFGPMQELDPDDDDGDGLSNSWEKSLGSDAWMVDTDGDGISDYHEFLAGTDMLDDTLYLRVSEVIPTADGWVHVGWESVSGKRYQLQAAHGLAGEAAVFANVGGEIDAMGVETSATVSHIPGITVQHFRVKVVESTE